LGIGQVAISCRPGGHIFLSTRWTTSGIGYVGQVDDRPGACISAPPGFGYSSVALAAPVFLVEIPFFLVPDPWATRVGTNGAER
jgi:hypothetical protein